MDIRLDIKKYDIFQFSLIAFDETEVKIFSLQLKLGMLVCS